LTADPGVSQIDVVDGGGEQATMLKVSGERRQRADDLAEQIDQAIASGKAAEFAAPSSSTQARR
jgi:hypothetical protein